MQSDRPLARAISFLLADPRAVALITAAYVLAGIAMLYSDFALNNEGLIIHYTGIWAWMDFPAVFFVQKAKPVLSLLYALPSSGGVLWTMGAHLLLSAMALPLIADFARRLDYRLPNFAALVLGFSPIFFIGGAAGIANNDAIAGTALVLFLLARGHSLSAGVVLGCLPWIRSELALLVPILWLHAIWIEPNRRFALGATLFPLVYALTGAFYHRDILWLLHYPPSSPFNPDNPMWQGLPIGPQYFLGLVAAVTPVAGLVACLPFARLRPLERTLLFYAAVTMLLLEILPVFRIGNFGGSPRYVSQILPVLALLTARSLEVWYEGDRPRAWAAALAIAATAWSVTRVPELAYAAPIVVLVACTVTLAWLRRGHAAILAATLLALAGPLLVPGTQISRQDTAAYLDPMEEWLRANGDAIEGPVYTNSQMIEAFAELRDLPLSDVRFLIAFDHQEGIDNLTNPHNGQREAILRLMEQRFYGHGVIADSLQPDDLAPGTLFLLRVDRRLDITLPPSIWGDRLEVLFERDAARVARLLPAAPAAP